VLELTGFDAIRSYVFGGADGIPPLAGYALGYKLVQAYLANTGSSVSAASFVPAHEIIAESRFFG
jgi:uncharacterized protein YjaZ